MKKNKIAIILISTMLLCALTGCGKEAEVVEKKNIVVETQFPQNGDLVLQNNFMGQIAPQEEVYVIPLAAAEVTEAFVKVGDVVEEGDVLCKLDDSSAQLQLDSANASVAAAKASKQAATGGANKVQNMQTENGISQIEDGLNDITDASDELSKNIENVQKQMTELKTLKSDTKEEYSAAKALSDAAKAYMADPNDKASAKLLKNAGYDLSNPAELPNILTSIETDKAIKKATYDGVKQQYDAGYGTLAATEEELKAARKELEKQYDTTQDSLQLAQESYEISKGQIADETAAVYDTQVQAASVGVKSAEYQLDFYTLKAPIGGVVEAVNAEVNGFVSSSNPAYIISNKDSMTVTFKVSEDIRNTLNVGDKISLDRNGRMFDGTLTEVGSMVDMASGLFIIKGNVKASGDELLTGTSVKVTADTKREESKLLIPYDALYYDNEVAYVYVAKQDKAEKVEVEVGLFNDEKAAILSGITAEDEIIVSWSAQLSDGAGISVKKQEAGNESDEIND